MATARLLLNTNRYNTETVRSLYVKICRERQKKKQPTDMLAALCYVMRGANGGNIN